MNAVDQLANYLKKALPDEDYTGSSPTPVMTGEAGPPQWGETAKPMSPAS